MAETMKIRIFQSQQDEQIEMPKVFLEGMENTLLFFSKFCEKTKDPRGTEGEEETIFGR